MLLLRWRLLLLRLGRRHRRRSDDRAGLWPRRPGLSGRILIRRRRRLGWRQLLGRALRRLGCAIARIAIALPIAARALLGVGVARRHGHSGGRWRHRRRCCRRGRRCGRRM
jgi:hypothetical protein